MTWFNLLRCKFGLCYAEFCKHQATVGVIRQFSGVAAISVCLVWTQPDTSSPKAHNSQSHQRKNILINCRVSADSVTLKTRFTHQLLFKPDHSLSTKDGFGFMNWNTFIVRLGKQVDRQRFSSKSQKKSMRKLPISFRNYPQRLERTLTGCGD